MFDRLVLQFNIVCRDFNPRVATLEELAVDPKRPIIDAYWAESAAHRRTLSRAGLYAAATVLDITRWNVQRIGLWRSADDAARANANAQQLTVLAVVGSAVHRNGFTSRLEPPSNHPPTKEPACHSFASRFAAT